MILSLYKNRWWAGFGPAGCGLPIHNLSHSVCGVLLQCQKDAAPKGPSQTWRLLGDVYQIELSSHKISEMRIVEGEEMFL